ncbi:MAG: diacylglycerol kinase family protein [Thermoanaerobaculia bacterium]
MPKSIPVLLNECAGPGEKDRSDEVQRAFAACGLTAEILIRAKDEDMGDLVKRAAKTPGGVVVVGGGDGSLNAAAGALAGTQTVLGILPMGTLNHFAKALGIGPSLADAASIIASGVIRSVDVGEVNGRVFINNAGLGIYPAVVRLRVGLQERLGRGKWPAFAIALWRNLRNHRLLRVRVKLHGEEHLSRTPFVFVGNNVYTMEGLDLGTRATLEGGALCLYMARRNTAWSLIRLALRALFGRLHQAEDFQMLTADSFRIETPKSHALVGLDGEVERFETPLECRIRARALRVLAPAVS